MDIPTAMFFHEDGRRCVLHIDSDKWRYRSPKQIRPCPRPHPKKDWITPDKDWVEVLNDSQ